MKKILALLTCAFIVSGCSVFQDNQSNVGSLLAEKITLPSDSSFEEVASVVKSSIVGICGKYSNGESVGSGVCVSESGYILTNSHCVSDSNSIVLYLSNSTTATAQIIYDNSVSDLAIIKSSVPLPYLEIGDSDELNVGQDIMAVGTPLSLSLTHSFTKGIVSALNRTLRVDNSGGEGFMQNLIQHDASLNPGNSGGPLLNSRGQVVGINTLKISSGEGVGFAIPSKGFASLVNSYVESSDYELPYLGVYGLDGQIANYYDSSKNNKGFYVIDIAASSPLLNCGIKPGAIITSFNGVEINNTLDLQNELYKLDACDTVYLQYEIDGELYTIKTKLK